MVFVEIVTFCLAVILVVGVLDQILVPLFTGRPVFWRFRRSTTAHRLGEVEEQLRETELRDQLARAEAELATHSKPGTDTPTASTTGKP